MVVQGRSVVGWGRGEEGRGGPGLSQSVHIKAICNLCLVSAAAARAKAQRQGT